MRGNPIVNLTNFFLGGVFLGGLVGGLIFFFESPPHAKVGIVERTAGDDEKTEALAQGESLVDSDQDGIPDQWEEEHHLDPQDSADATSDFDEDGLTAFQEYKFGSNPFGHWIEIPVDLGFEILPETVTLKGFTASGHVLAQGRRYQPGASYENMAVLWHPEKVLVTIPKPDNAYISVMDVNEAGEVVGGYLSKSTYQYTPFHCSASQVVRDLEIPIGMGSNVFGDQINDWGQVLLQANGNSSFKSAVVGRAGNVMAKSGNDDSNQRFTALNNFGEILGVHTNSFTGVPTAFLRLPNFPDFDTSLAASYPELFGLDAGSQYHRTARMNDYGEFGYDHQVDAHWSSQIRFYLFDGDYRSFGKPEDGHVRLVDLNNSSQVLFHAQVSANPREFRLSSSGHTVPLRDVFYSENSSTEVTFTHLNDHGEILGYRGQSRTPFILSLSQDADDDGMSDDWEAFYRLDPNSASDAYGDLDGDGYSNLAEFRLNRNPNLEEVASPTTGNMADMRPGIDTDGDGMPNVWEIQYGFNWEDPSDAPLDLDRDGYSNLDEFILGTTPAGAPVFEAHFLDDEISASTSGLTFSDDGALLGMGISPDEQWTGLEYGIGESTQWFFPRDPGGRSRIYSANLSHVGGYETSEGSWEQHPALWNRATGEREEVQSPSSIRIKNGNIAALAQSGPHGLVSFNTVSSNNRKLALMFDGQLGTELQPRAGSVYPQHIYQPSSVIHESGAGVACARYPGNSYRIFLWQGLQNPQFSVFETGRSMQIPQINRRGPLVAAWTSGRGEELAVSVLENASVSEVGYPGATNFKVNAVSNDGVVSGYATIKINGIPKNKPFLLRKDGNGLREFAFFSSDEETAFSSLSLNGHQEAVASFGEGGLNQFRIWRGVEMFFDLNEQVVDQDPNFRVTSLRALTDQGVILAYAEDSNRSGQCVLVPVADTDGDGATDHWEIAHSLDPFDAEDGQLDLDNDGLSNSEEHRNGTDPHSPDTDQDTMKDGWEVEWGLDPLSASDAHADPDRDQVQNRFEHALQTAPTGIYQLQSTPIPGADAGSSFSLQVSRNYPEGRRSVVRGSISGVTGSYLVEHESGRTTRIPPLAPGKYVMIKEAADSGLFYGYGYDANWKVRAIVVHVENGTAETTIINIPTSENNPYVMIRDVSDDERSVLVRRRTPDNVYSTDVFTLVEGDSLANSEAVLEVSFPDASRVNEWDLTDFYSTYSPEVCQGPRSVVGVETPGVDRFYPESVVENVFFGELPLMNEVGQGANDPEETDMMGKRNHFNLVDFSELLWPEEIDPDNSYAWGSTLPVGDARGYLTYSWDCYANNGNDQLYRNLVIDYVEGEAGVLAAPTDIYSSVIDGNASMAGLVRAGSRILLSSLNDSLNLDALRVIGSAGSNVPANSLPKAGLIIDGGTSGARFLDDDGEVIGLSKGEAGVEIWSLINAADLDENETDDDLEAFENELREGILAASENKDLDENQRKAILNAILGSSSNTSANFSGGPQISDRDGDGIEDHLDAHPDDRIIDWKKGKRPTFAVVEVEGLDQIEVSIEGQSQNAHLDFSLSGNYAISTPSEVKYFTPFSGNAAANQSYLVVQAGQKVPESVRKILFKERIKAGDPLPDAQSIFLEGGVSVPIALDEGSAEGPSIHLEQVFNAQEYYDHEDQVGGFLLMQSDAVDGGGLSFSIPEEPEDGESVQAHLHPFSEAVRLSGSDNHSAFSLVADLSITRHQVETPDGAPPSYYFSDGVTRSMLESWGDIPQEYQFGDSLSPYTFTNGNSTQSRAYVSANSGAFKRLSLPSGSQFGIKATSGRGVAIPSQAIRQIGQVGMGSGLNSHTSLGRCRNIATSYSLMDYNYLSPLPQAFTSLIFQPLASPRHYCHVMYRNAAQSENGQTYPIEKVVSETIIGEFEHENFVGVCDVEGKGGGQVSRSLWAAGSTLYVKKSSGNYRESTVKFSRGGDIRGISSQGWIARNGIEGHEMKIPQLFYASANGGLWKSLTGLLSDSSPYTYSVDRVFELERNGLILTKVTRWYKGNRSETLAILVPVEADSEDATEMVEAPELVVPDRYRSIALDGRPKHEGAPQGEAEEDLPAERGNIDVYTRQLKYDTSHAFVPVPASDLALQVTQVHSPAPIALPVFNASEDEVYRLPDGSIDLEKKTRAHGAFFAKDVGPFGVGWSSNLSSTLTLSPVIEKVEPGKPEVLSHYLVTITDEAGRTHKFRSHGEDLTRFSIEASRFVDAKAYQMSLECAFSGEIDKNSPDNSSIFSTHAVLRKKYGTTLRFDWIGNAPPAGFDLEQEIDAVPVFPIFKARLSKVTDRFHQEGAGTASSALLYDYPTDDPVSRMSFFPNRIYVEGRSALAVNIIAEETPFSKGHYGYPLVRAITDPRGQTTTFSYKWHLVSGAHLPVIHTIKKPDGGTTTFEYKRPRISAPPIPNRRVNIDLDGTVLDGFDGLGNIGNFIPPGQLGSDEEPIEIEIDDKKLLEAKCHINLGSITNPVGETYSFEYEPDGRYDSTIAKYKATARVSKALHGHRLANHSRVKTAINTLKEEYEESLRESYEERFTRQGGVLLSSASVDEDGVKKMIFGLPKIGGADRIKKVHLPRNPSLSAADQPVVILNQPRPVLQREINPDQSPWPPSNLDDFNDFPFQWISSQSGQSQPAKASTVTVTDAELSETKYSFGKTVYGTALLENASRLAGFAPPGQQDEQFAKILNASALAYTEVSITNHLDQTIKYTLDPLAGFALKSSIDLNGHKVEYHYDDAIDEEHHRSSAVGYSFVSEGGATDQVWNGGSETDTDGLANAGVRYADPTREIHYAWSSGDGTPNSGSFTETRSRSYAYSDHYRIMSRAVDFRGAVTVWNVLPNGNRSSEKRYAPPVPPAPGDPTAVGRLLKETNFEYTSRFPAFLTQTTIESSGPGQDTRQDWETDLVTQNLPDEFGRVEMTIANPLDDEIETHSTYDLGGNKLTSTDGRGKITSFEYDSVGRLIATHYPGPNQTTATKELFYNKASRLIRSRNENGVDTIYQFDHRGRRVATTLDLNRNRQVDLGDLTTRKIFNKVNQVLEVTDPNGNTSTNQYDSLHRLVSTTDADDKQTRIYYDDQVGRIPGSGLLDGSGYSPSRTIGPRGYIAEITQDSLYRTVESRSEFILPDDPGDWHSRPLESHSRSKVSYDLNGNIDRSTAYRSANGDSSEGILETTTEYDGLNRPIKVTTAPGTNLANSVHTFYTLTGLAWRSIAYEGLDGLERTTETEYDGHGRRVKVWSPDPLTGAVVKVLRTTLISCRVSKLTSGDFERISTLSSSFLTIGVVFLVRL